MIKTFELIVEGQVQRVGFRNFASRTALELNVRGKVENIRNEKVKIIAQGEKEKILEFIKGIWVTEWPIDVWNIEKKEIEISERFDRFKIIRGKFQEELSERLDEAATYLQKLGKDMNKNFEKLNTTMTTQFEKLNNHMDNNFNKLDEKYGKVSTLLEDSNKKLEKLDKLTMLDVIDKKLDKLDKLDELKKLDTIDKKLDKLEKIEQSLQRIETKF